MSSDADRNTSAPARHVWSPPGTSLTETERILNEAEDIIRANPDVEGYSRRLGSELGPFVTEAYRGDFAFGTLVRFLPIVSSIFLWSAIYGRDNDKVINEYTAARRADINVEPVVLRSRLSGLQEKKRAIAIRAAFAQQVFGGLRRATHPHRDRANAAGLVKRQPTAVVRIRGPAQVL